MFLECFYKDTPPKGSAWVYDIHNPKCLVVGKNGIEVRSGGTIIVDPFPITDRLEEIAEEMLALAADFNEPLSKEEILRRYEACPQYYRFGYLSDTELDVPSNGFLRICGREVAIPTPDYLGIFVSGPVGANLVLYNLRTVIPVLGHPC